MSKDIRLSYIINNLCVVMKIKNVLKLTKLVWCLQAVKLREAFIKKNHFLIDIRQ